MHWQRCKKVAWKLSKSSHHSSIDQKQLNCWFEGNIPGTRVERRVVGIKHEREIVPSVSDPVDLLIVSRFDPKILAQIDNVIACVPEILDGNGIREVYKKLAVKRPSDLKTLIWRDAVEELLVLSIKKKLFLRTMQISFAQAWILCLLFWIQCFGRHL